RIEIGEDEDEQEAMFARGWSDGLPLVPPTEERVLRMLDGTARDPQEVLGLVPPALAAATVEKIAINAVMAGCRPEYLPVVIAGVEAMCDDAFDLHGVSATTNFHSPLFIVNGPARTALDINCAAGVFGPGWRANGTIGRALRLIVANVGGASARTMSMSTMAHPGRYTYCMGEHEEQNPWDSLAVEHGFSPGDSTVAAFAGEAPHGVYDHQSRTAKDLLITISKSLEVISHSKSTHHGDTLLVFSPEHARTIAGDGWSKADMREFLWHRLRKPVSELIPGVDGGEGLPARVLAKFPRAESDSTLIPKFREPANLKFVVAGGTAGRFTAVIPGWTFPKMSRLVIKAVRATP
ncbi:MAG TPA: thioredoxin, partial [Methylomirabilota bacterium]